MLALDMVKMIILGRMLLNGNCITNSLQESRLHDKEMGRDRRDVTISNIRDTDLLRESKYIIFSNN